MKTESGSSSTSSMAQYGESQLPMRPNKSKYCNFNISESIGQRDEDLLYADIK